MMDLQHPIVVTKEPTLSDANASSTTCEACRHLELAVILENWDDKDTWKPWKDHAQGGLYMREQYKGHLHRLSLLRQSARQCGMCSLIVDHWPVAEKGGEGHPEYDPEYWIVTRLCNWDFDLSKSFYIHTNLGLSRFEILSGAPELDKDVMKYPKVRGQRSYRCPRTETHTYSGSDECFALAGKWIAECTSTHTACAATELHFTPTRLLDTKAGDSKQEVCLRESHTICEPYIALSHCWGGKVALRTTEANKKAHLRKIQPADIPHTFQDAITIVRSLGYRYLWIDALCIVQDSSVDWKEEAAVMDRVYAGATLTISAADSANSWSGIFTRRYQPRSVPSGLSYVDGLDLPYLEGLDLHDLHVCALERYEDPYENISASILNSRAWTLQERLLSRANLHFTKNALVWECRTHTRTEDGHYSKSHTLFKHVRNYPSDLNNETSMLQWYIVVAEYSKRNMTYDSDKLEALGGLANNFAKTSHATDYAWGLWMTDLPRGLLWMRSVDSRFLETLPNFAPSWSWSSRKGSILYWITSADNRLIESYLDLRIHEAPSNNASSRLLVEGYLQETFHDPKAYGLPTGFVRDVHFSMDNPRFRGLCWCLYIESRVAMDAGQLNVRFLVLDRSSEEDEAVFQRIGEAHFGVPEDPLSTIGERVSTMMEDPRKVHLTLI